ncbi:MAG TPA: hypothetical protein VKA94_12115 [Hyphomicrobiales bacterium]|nr:hypothetical protein [Hyphomicrobiales bacterium]
MVIPALPFADGMTGLPGASRDSEATDQIVSSVAGVTGKCLTQSISAWARPWNPARKQHHHQSSGGDLRSQFARLFTGLDATARYMQEGVIRRPHIQQPRAADVKEVPAGAEQSWENLRRSIWM